MLNERFKELALQLPSHVPPSIIFIDTAKENIDIYENGVRSFLIGASSAFLDNYENIYREVISYSKKRFLSSRPYDAENLEGLLNTIKVDFYVTKTILEDINKLLKSPTIEESMINSIIEDIV